jgi:hypothetical protein
MFNGPQHNIIVWSGPDTRVCFMTSDGAAKENARLIAAAPDLLEALKASNEKLQALLFVGDGHPLVKANLGAIAKAEGRS